MRHQVNRFTERAEIQTGLVPVVVHYSVCRFSEFLCLSFVMQRQSSNSSQVSHKVSFECLIESVSGLLKSQSPQKHILAAFPVAQLAFLTFFHKDFWELEFKALALLTLHSPAVKHIRGSLRWAGTFWGRCERCCWHTEVPLYEKGEGSWITIGLCVRCVNQECFRSLEVINLQIWAMSPHDWGRRYSV